MDLARHCQQAAALVSTWPEWKRNVLGEYPKMTEDDDLVEISVRTDIFVNLLVPRAMAAKWDKSDLSEFVEHLLDVQKMRSPVRWNMQDIEIESSGCPWDGGIPDDNFSVDGFCPDEWPNIEEE